MASIKINNVDDLNKALAEYDLAIFAQLKPVIEEIATKSQALASSLEKCFIKFQNSNRYLTAYEQKSVAINDSELNEFEFMIFREYVRLLRSCTIMCGHEVSAKYRELFMDFFAGKRLELAKELGKS